MTNSELQSLVEKISLESFGKPFLAHAYFNRRLKTTGGRFHLSSHDIDINPKMLENFSIDVLVGVIKHELCHYHLYLAGIDAKHGRKFKELLQAVGGSRYAPTVRKPQKVKYCYVCSQCGLEYKRKRKIDLGKYVCGRCHGRLHLIKEN